MILLMRNRFLATFITIHMVLFVTSPAFAALIPSMGPDGTPQADVLQKDLGTIQKALETKMVQEKLKAYGFTAQEIAAKLPSMTPGQIHILAQASDDILAGGDGLGAVIAILVIILLVIVILKLMNKDIIIKMSGLDDHITADCAHLG